MDEHRPSPAFESARTERANLRRAIGGLESALAAPAGRRAGEWLSDARAAVQELRRSVEVHIETTERPDGILTEIVRLSPRLAAPVERLRIEHVEFRATLSRELALFEAAPESPDPEWVSARREALTDLLTRLVRHRQRGADLTYEAYEVDIGGES